MSTGHQPISTAMKSALAAMVEKREPNEIIVVHHYTDSRDQLQLEVERRSDELGIKFERIKIKGDGL